MNKAKYMDVARNPCNLYVSKAPALDVNETPALFVNRAPALDVNETPALDVNKAPALDGNKTRTKT